MDFAELQQKKKATKEHAQKQVTAHRFATVIDRVLDPLLQDQTVSNWLLDVCFFFYLFLKNEMLL